jgi:outer membrane receptor protein involved in Fe transport
MRKIFSTCMVAWLCIASTVTNAQQHIDLSGKVNAPGASVFLLKAKDSLLVKTAIADSSGAYYFQQLAVGEYILSVTMTGYQDYRSSLINLQQSKILDDIVLTISTGMLNNVTVTAQRPYVQQKIDRTVINPEALISNAGSTGLEVLEKAPGVIIDPNGGITLKGKSVIIFIDDKPTYLSGADLQNYLRSLPAASIDQLELMTNPPAKYDAAGNGGVINIRTKRSKLKGFNGGITLNYIQGKYGKTNDNFNFNFRSGKLNISGNLGYFYNNAFTDLVINRHFLDGSGALKSNFIQTSFIRNRGSNYLAKIGADYYVSEKSTIGIHLTGIYNPSNTITPVNSLFTNASNSADSSIIAANAQHRSFRNGGVNLNFRHEYKKNGPALSADLDYLNYRTSNDQTFDNQSYFADGSLKSKDLLTGFLPAHINIYSGKVDYEQPLANGMKLETGLKASYTHTDNVADYFFSTNGITSPDYDKTNHFIYKENIYAAYINTSKEIKRFSFQAGLRLENTVSDGHQLGNVQKPDSAFRRSYTSLFPTAYIQYKTDTAGRNTISLNYGRRIDRPYYQDLNPFISPLDKFTFYTGNPFLKPSFSDNIELQFTYHDKYTAGFAYSRTRDDVNETIEIVDRIYYSRPGNIGRYTVMTFSLDGTYEPVKWFSFQFHTEVSQLHSVSDFYTGKLDTKGTFTFLRPIFTFKPGKDWSIQLDGGYQSKITNAQFVIQDRKRINAAISKKLSSIATIKLVVNDIFYMFGTRGTINNLANTTANWTNWFDSRTAVFSFTYRFGKAISGQRKHDANGAESEQNRVKN